MLSHDNVSEIVGFVYQVYFKFSGTFTQLTWSAKVMHATLSDFGFDCEHFFCYSTLSHIGSQVFKFSMILCIKKIKVVYQRG